MQSQANSNSAFTGSVPENYDSHLGPMFFLPYAKDLAERTAALQPSTVLETAAGTGIVTEQLVLRLPNARITATDLNPAMIERAKSVRPSLGVVWQPADATDLPFGDGSFDAVVSQFGVMFFPDKQESMNEAFRVLKPGGTFLFNVWESLEKNDVSRVASETLIREFEADPPPFLGTPYGFFDSEAIVQMLSSAGFDVEKPVWVSKECVAESALSAATGIIQGTPASQQIVDRGGVTADVRDKVAATLAERYGDRPMSVKMEAIVFVAKKPG
jgi:SAM-dependent methyltransferase